MEVVFIRRLVGLDVSNQESVHHAEAEAGNAKNSTSSGSGFHQVGQPVSIHAYGPIHSQLCLRNLMQYM